MAWIKKHINAIIVVVLSTTLLLTQNLKAEAGSYTLASFTLETESGGPYSVTIRQTNYDTMLPDSIYQEYDANNEPLNRAVGNYDFDVNPIIVLPSNLRSETGYYGGYLNGTLRFQISFGATYTASNANYQRHQAEDNMVKDDNIVASCYNYYKSGNNYVYLFSVVFNNYSVPNTSTDRYINIGSMISQISMNFNNTTDAPSITLTPSITNISSSLTYTAVANAGSSIAGQVYSAIENSPSIEEIIHWLDYSYSLGWDIYTAVSNINLNQIPTIILWLSQIKGDTGNISTYTNNAQLYLKVISDSWPQYSSMVLYYLNEIVNMNAEQSSQAAAIESQYQANANAVATGVAGMSVAAPDLNAGDINIMGELDTGTTNNLFNFFALFGANSLIGTLMVIAAMGMTIGFVMYGKKG